MTETHRITHQTFSRLTLPHLRRGGRLGLPALGFGLASAILAFSPLSWLWNTWQDPSYQSGGMVYGFMVLGLALWSLSSPILTPKPAHQRAILLLFLAALLRLASQVMAINIIGGVALAIDVYALLTLLNLSARKRAASPFWLSVLFLFSLPFERIAQRILGYPMQEMSASAACQILKTGFDQVVCEGIRLQVEAKDVLVDLPCSGTQSLMLALAAFVCLNVVTQPSFRKAILWGFATCLLAILANGLRISLLAFGLVYEEELGFSVMAEPWHGFIGLFTLGLGLAPLLWGYRLSPSKPQDSPVIPAFSLPSLPKKATGLFSLVFVGLALVIVSLPRQALDVSRQLPALTLPARLAEHMGQPVPLEPIEKAYFTQYGGTAQKAFYGPMALTLVQTTSPLRHLHSPDDCLRGLGLKVSFVGSRFAPVPTAIYRAEDENGRAWQVAISFVSDTGHASSNVAEAIWHWLKRPETSWISLQRITPWQMEGETRNRLDLASFAALDITFKP